MSPDTSSEDSPAGFRFIGGRPCLDFVATLGKRHTTPVEKLPEPAALARWFELAGLHDPGAGGSPLTARDLRGRWLCGRRSTGWCAPRWPAAPRRLPTSRW